MKQTDYLERDVFGFMFKRNITCCSDEWLKLSCPNLLKQSLHLNQFKYKITELQACHLNIDAAEQNPFLF